MDALLPLLLIIVLHVVTQQKGCNGDGNDEFAVAECTALQTPALGAPEVAVDTRLSWPRSEKATGYLLQIGTESDKDGLLPEQDLGDTTAYQPLQPLPFNQQIFVTVTAYAIQGNPATRASDCQEISFHTAQAPDIPCPRITSPANNKLDVAHDATLAWEPVAEADNYRVLLIRKKGTARDTVLQKDTREQSTTLLFSLDPGNAYEALVLPYNRDQQGFQANCAGISFTTRSGTVPECTRLRFPTNGESNVATSQTLTWASVSGKVQGYYLQLNAEPWVKVESEIALKEDLLRFYYPAAGLTPSTTYSVKIAPYNEFGIARTCPSQVFTTGSEPPAGVPVYVRKNIAELDPDHPDLLTYRYAYEVMRNLPNDHGHNWQQQADIHKCHCQHGSWYFLPWHRAYLYYLEEAVREVSKNNNFALPYWDWGKDPKVPEVFWQWPFNQAYRGKTTAQSNPIWQDKTNSYVVDTLKLRENIFPLTLYGYNAEGIENAAGTLERGAHNRVHSAIGGSMGTTRAAALDPIFWTHHGNIDRLWAKWSAMGKGSIKNADWEGHTFAMQFYDRKGDLIPAVAVSEVDSIEKLGYTYDELATPDGLAALDNFPALEDWLIDEGLMIEQAFPAQQPADRAIAVTLPAPDTGEFFEVLEEVIAGDEDLITTALLYIDGLKPDNEDIELMVFLDQDNLSSRFSSRDPHFVGFIDIFKQGEGPNDCPQQEHMGHQGHHAHGGHGSGGYNYVFDLTHALRQIRAQNPNAFTDEEISLQFVPRQGSQGGYQLGELTVFFVTYIGG
jgi:hypothetical protein